MDYGYLEEGVNKGMETIENYLKIGPKMVTITEMPIMRKRNSLGMSNHNLINTVLEWKVNPRTIRKG